MSGTTEPASAPASELMTKLQDLESDANSITERLGALELSTEQATQPLTNQELLLLHESLKRLSSRLGVSRALIERLIPQSEAVAETDKAEKRRTQIVTPEDEIFPLQDSTDPSTGLPTRVIAEKALALALAHGRPRYASFFVVDRIRHMSNRYRGDVGNQAMRHYHNFLRDKLPAEALIFRWRGASFLTLFEISGSLADAKMQMEQIVILKQKFSFITNNRSAMVNLTASFLTLPLSEHQSTGTLEDVVDVFIEAHSSRQPS